MVQQGLVRRLMAVLLAQRCFGVVRFNPVRRGCQAKSRNGRLCATWIDCQRWVRRERQVSDTRATKAVCAWFRRRLKGCWVSRGCLVERGYECQGSEELACLVMVTKARPV